VDARRVLSRRVEPTDAAGDRRDHERQRDHGLRDHHAGQRERQRHPHRLQRAAEDAAPAERGQQADAGHHRRQRQGQQRGDRDWPAQPPRAAHGDHRERQAEQQRQPRCGQRADQ
jgi:hypothetical protein